MPHLAYDHAQRLVSEIVGSAITEDTQREFAASLTRAIEEIGCTLPGTEIPFYVASVGLLGRFAPFEIDPDDHTKIALANLLAKIPVGSILPANSPEQGALVIQIMQEIDHVWRLRLGVVKATT